jgi:spore coat polysaccharide biosynthesis protein SpsF (cytidylyltransferase family)
MSNFLDYAFVIQARLGSTRLPGKILLSFWESTVLGTLVDCLLAFGVPKKNIVIATSDNPLDDLAAHYAKGLGLQVVRGDETNVLERYQLAGLSHPAKNIVRMTSDNPLPDGRLIEYCVCRHERDRPDLTSTRVISPDGKIVRYVPKGMSVDIMNKDSLLEIDVSKCSAFEREHVIPFFYSSRRVSVVDNFITNRPDLSIDTLDDYVRVSRYLKQNVHKLMPWLHPELLYGGWWHSSPGHKVGR